jgi:hypothetical protein
MENPSIQQACEEGYRRRSEAGGGSIAIGAKHTFAYMGRLAVAAGRDGLLLALPLEHALLLRHLAPP